MQFFALTILARHGLAASLTPDLLAGQVRETVAKAERLLVARGGHSGADEELSEVAQLCGDLMLALDRAEDAEDIYRVAIKLAAAGQRGSVRVVSCRSTAFLSLHRQRFAMASSCFLRSIEDPAATRAQKVEALCGLAMARQALGDRACALAALDEAGREASADQLDPALSKLVALVRVEVMVHCEIRSHAFLRDHIFWHSQEQVQAAGDVQPLAAVEVCLAAHDRDDLIAQRLQQLRDLLLASYGDARALKVLGGHISRLRTCGLTALERAARMDSALIAISQRQAEMARGLMEPLLGRDAAAPFHQRWDMELSYCHAKVSELSGRVDEAMRYYQRYALESMQCVRAEAPNVDRPFVAPTAARGSVKDDIEMRLPAKYRRAYRYMQEHLDCVELSVREIADNMGVTERALQSAFRTHLGMTPGEVIQRCRVERIRADLLRDDGVGGSVIETAARWGIRNRSTLITSYRKHFNETPTETLARRRSPSTAGHA